MGLNLNELHGATQTSATKKTIDLNKLHLEQDTPPEIKRESFSKSFTPYTKPKQKDTSSNNTITELNKIYEQSKQIINKDGNKGKQTIVAPNKEFQESPLYKEQLFKAATEQGVKDNTYFSDPNFDFEGYRKYYQDIPYTEQLKRLVSDPVNYIKSDPVSIAKKYKPEESGKILSNYLNEGGVAGDIASGTQKGIIGIEDALRGIQNSVSGTLGGSSNAFREDPLNKSFKQERANVMNDRSFLRNLPENLATIGTQLVPSILTGGGTGLAIAGGIAGGQNAQQALDDGASAEQALLFGGVTGGAVALLERAFGFIPGTKMFNDALKGLTKNATRNVGQIAKQIGKNALGEGAEEVLIEPITQASKRAIYDDSVSINPFDRNTYGDNGLLPLKRMAEGGALGAIMGGIISGTNLPRNLQQAKQVQDYMGQNLQTDLDMGNNMPSTSLSFNLANQLANKPIDRITQEEYSNYLDVLKPEFKQIVDIRRNEFNNSDIGNVKWQNISDKINIPQTQQRGLDIMQSPIQDVNSQSQYNKGSLNQTQDIEKEQIYLPESKVEEFKPTKSYDEYQNEIDDMADMLIEKYGIDEVLKAPVYSEGSMTYDGTISKLTYDEIENYKRLFKLRDKVEEIEDSNTIQNTIKNVDYDGLGEKWIAGPVSVKNAVESMVNKYNLHTSMGNNTETSINEIATRLYNDLIQSTGAPQDFWGEPDYALKIAKGQTYNPFGQTLVPFLNQINQIVKNITGNDINVFDVPSKNKAQDFESVEPIFNTAPPPPTTQANYQNREIAQTSSMASNALPSQETNTDNVDIPKLKPISKADKKGIENVPLVSSNLEQRKKVKKDNIESPSTKKEKEIRPEERKSVRINVNLEAFGESENPLTNMTESKVYDQSLFPDNDTLSRTRSTLDKLPLRERAKIGMKDIYKGLFNRQFGIEKIDNVTGGDTKIRAMNSLKANAIVVEILSENLVDLQGKAKGKGLIPILQQLENNEVVYFRNLLLNRHGISRANEGKPIFPDLTAEKAQKNVNDILEQYPHFEEIERDVRKFMNDFRKIWLKDTGLISDELNDILSKTYPDYVPTQREFDPIEKVFDSGGTKKGFVDQPSQIKKAGTSNRNVDVLDNIFNMVNRTVRTAKKNEVAHSILEQVKNNPTATKSLVELLPSDYQGNKNLDDVFSVWDKGERVYLKVKDKEFQEAINSIVDDIKLGKPGNFFKRISNVFKSLITTKNPLFTIRNIMRDIPAAYIQGSTWNPYIFGKDIAGAIKDITTKSDVYQQYKGVGGQMSNFFAHGEYENYINKELKNLSRKNYNPVKWFKKLGDTVEDLNNITETMPRLAEFRRILRETGDVQKALYESGEVTVNFSRGGEWAKKIDAFVPYFNASLQGVDKTARQFINKETRLGAIGKSIIALTIPTIFFQWLNSDDDDYKKISNRDKDANFFIPIGDSKFIKIPKSRGYDVLFSTLLERLLRKIKGDDEAFKNYLSGVKASIGPVDPLTGSIFQGYLGLSTNKKWNDSPIVPQNLLDASPYLQFDEKTSEISKKLGQELGLSPKKIDYLIDAYTGIVGDILLPAFTVSGGDTEISRAMSVIEQKFTTDSEYSNQDITNFYENIDKLNTKATDLKKLGEKKDLLNNALLNAFKKSSTDIKDVKLKILKTNDVIIRRQYQKEIATFAKDLNEMLKEKDTENIYRRMNDFKRTNLKK